MNPEPSSLLASLFPPGVAAFELREPGDSALLHPEERQHLAKAAARRVGDFAAGRLCARQVLAELGIHGCPLLMGGDGRPLWPADLVGSITHTRGYYGAVGARRARLRAIGVDAEVVGRVGRHLWPKVCTPAERAWLEPLPEGQQARFSALVFSAKEAFYKCQYELTQAWVGFQDVELEPLAGEPEAGPFTIRPTIRPLARLALEERLAQPWTGRWRLEGGLVVSGMAVPGEGL
ncbi:MAG TPA: 4'-phosphopantetheinyl transferase superfamily protein [Nevskia sp.]|jgi:4'-phosphopantetheinyl transferase EntD|nr:4'-phosphopantetheinyl transferase superfamily protein [Nevskia sp.]